MNYQKEWRKVWMNEKKQWGYYLKNDFHPVLKISTEEFVKKCKDAETKFGRSNAIVQHDDILTILKDPTRSTLKLPKYTSLKHLLKNEYIPYSETIYTLGDMLKNTQPEVADVKKHDNEAVPKEYKTVRYDEYRLNDIDDLLMTYKRLPSDNSEIMIYGPKHFCRRNGISLMKWNMACLLTLHSRYLLALIKDPFLEPLAEQLHITDKQLILSGSFAEGTATEFTIDYAAGTADIDMMDLIPLTVKITNLKYRRGYVRLKYHDIHHLDNDWKLDSNGYLLSSEFIKCRVNEMFKEPYSSKYAATNLSGPAIGILGGINPPNHSKLQDLVHGFHACGRWPRKAEDWRVRERPSDWPSQALIDDILSKGICVVPVAHPLSKNPDIEWRISFSECEVVLMRSLSRKQKKCFMLVKHFCKLLFDGFKLLSTYHIKTTFLWMMEQHPPSLWEERVLKFSYNVLLDRLINCCKKKNIQNYFIKGANLLDHFTDDHMETVTEKLVTLRACRDYYDLPKYIREDYCLQDVCSMEE